MLSACEKGDTEAWRTFLSHYTPMVSRLLEVYAPQLGEDARKSLWQEALQALVAEDYSHLRGFDHQAEREFLMDLKWFVLELAYRRHLGRDAEAPRSPDSVRSRLDGRPIAHQEIILLSLSGYSRAAIEKVLTAPGTLVATALAPVTGKESVAATTPAIEPLDWLKILPQVRAARKPECPPPRAFVRILDGQASWYDKTPAENHMAACLHCLETWATLREADFLRRDTIPLAGPEVEVYLSAVGLAAAPAARPWTARLFGR